jgi:2-oxoglutarate dehydrogenase E2 component (dihydrolipoamide succinyltransferase)
LANEVKVPRLAESISEAVLVQWLKEDGAAVRADEPIATLETDKAAVEIPADREGVLRHARKVGDKVVVGDVIARIEDGAGAAASSVAPQEKKEGRTEAPAAPPPRKEGPTEAPAPPPARAAVPSSRGGSPAAPPSRGSAPQAPPSRPAPASAEEPLAPAVRRMVEEFGLDPAQIEASGKGGRLLKEDVQRYLESRGPQQDRKQVEAGASRSAGTSTPARPSEARTSAPTPAQSPPATTGALDWAEGEEERAVPMSRIRQRIAERLVQAQQTAAILTTFNEVDMSAVNDLRTRFKESFEQRHGVRLSLMSFFTRACILALQQVPQINAEIRGTDIVYKRHVHMGIAVQTERGLVVPVVHGADQRSFADLEREIARLANAARENKLSLFELSGGTFTISNGGVFGSLLSTPILNPPQSGILGMHKIEKRPVVVEDEIVIRPMMYLALSYDHRIVDGEQAVTFLVSVKQRLEDPERMLLDI